MHKKLLFFIIIILFNRNNLYGKEQIFLQNNQIILIKSDFGQLKKWTAEDYSYALYSFLVSCEKFQSLPQDNNLMPQINKNIKVKDILKICAKAKKIKNANNNIIQVFFENYFIPYLVYDNLKKTEFGTFTGYYLPEINISFKQNSKFQYPLYSKPNNLNYTRGQIDAGILKYQNLELLYTDDLVELFFLQIQGSGYGRIEGSDELISIGFNGKNNYEYTSLGSYLIKQKLLPPAESNAIGIKNFLKTQNTNTLKNLMQNNKSYVFFKIIEDDTIIGSHGVSLNSLVSLAVDTSILPLGFPIWLETEITTRSKENIEFKKLMISQDTGSAIKGAVRGDIFFGSGSEAEEYASFQAGRGRYFILIPKEIAKALK